MSSSRFKRYGPDKRGRLLTDKGRLASKHQQKLYKSWLERNLLEVFDLEKGGRRLRYREGYGRKRRLATREQNLYYKEDIKKEIRADSEAELDKIKRSHEELYNWCEERDLPTDLPYDPSDYDNLNQLCLYHVIKAYRLKKAKGKRKAEYEVLSWRGLGPVRKWVETLYLSANATSTAFATSFPIIAEYSLQHIGIKTYQRWIERMKAARGKRKRGTKKTE